MRILPCSRAVECQLCSLTDGFALWQQVVRAEYTHVTGLCGRTLCSPQAVNRGPVRAAGGTRDKRTDNDPRQIAVVGCTGVQITEPLPPPYGQSRQATDRRRNCGWERDQKALTSFLCLVSSRDVVVHVHYPHNQCNNSECWTSYPLQSGLPTVRSL
ncbi:hypothetical protein OH76DRAFT_932278 [Lentinus brumalis]|uniref:Uncharacterized protein n=1 Tax=Lentinus brumalis TaxID=2498619 RepID=A0A371CZQ0_9APHY|nr:hypothetical protein OH76DRAFT_932278 [Polyporus brumalis]